MDEEVLQHLRQHLGSSGIKEKNKIKALIKLINKNVT
jgi:hypothetical protein